jgi:YgiT-type zinc finger domain-containing protein
MRCIVCRQGDTEPGTTTITLERGGTTLVVKSVPARVCDTCGERYVDDETVAQLLEQADQAAHGGVQVEVRAFAAA